LVGNGGSLRVQTAPMVRLSASPSTLFGSTRVGGPSFESYAGASDNSTYDAAGRLTSLTDANAAVTRFGYDSAGNLSSLTDPVGNTTQWSYAQNSLTRPTQEASASLLFQPIFG
jgi:YD repeat-containing protein